MKLIRLLGELLQSCGTVHTHSLTWLALTLTGTKPSMVTPVLVLRMSAVKPIYNVAIPCFNMNGSERGLKMQSDCVTPGANKKMYLFFLE